MDTKLKNQLNKIFKELWDFDTIVKNYKNPYEECYPEVYEKLAKEEEKEFGSLKWSTDCGMKLDYDGCLVSINTRTYPPHKNDGCWGKGSISLYVLDKEIKNIPIPEFSSFKEVVEFVENEVSILKEEVINKIKEI